MAHKTHPASARKVAQKRRVRVSAFQRVGRKLWRECGDHRSDRCCLRCNAETRKPVFRGPYAVWTWTDFDIVREAITPSPYDR